MIASASQADDNDSGFGYKVAFIGLEGTGLEKTLRDHSDLERLRKETPASIWDLRARISSDLETFATVLRAEGYFGARLTYNLRRQERPLLVQIRVDTGERFTVEDYTITFAGGAAVPGTVQALARQAAEAQIGQPSRNEDIIDTYDAVLKALPENGYPRAELMDRQVTADHLDKSVTVAVTIDPGQAVVFGSTAIAGLTKVREPVVREQIPWKEGDVFDARKINDYRQTLVELDLFDSIAIETDAALIEQNGKQTLPILVDLTESKHRTIGVGAAYSTSDGPSGEVFWEHRNFRGRDETLLLRARGGLDEGGLSADFTRPRFLRRDQTLFLGVDGTYDDTNAFREYSATIDGAVERILTDRWKVRIGAELSYLDIRDPTGQREFILFGTPATVWYDGSNDLLDPTTGFRTAVTVAPYVALDEGAFFTTVEISSSAYFPLDERRRYVIAVRNRVGFLFGEGTFDVPATKRFYAGGAGSIRGYGYQLVGPLDAEGDPLGGRSLFEVGLEFRIRFLESWGVSPFIEGGNVFNSAYPDFSRQLRWGAGIGVQYYTSFGPVRLDVGFPINPRPRDDAFQIYVSIGQSF